MSIRIWSLALACTLGACSAADLVEGPTTAGSGTNGATTTVGLSNGGTTVSGSGTTTSGTSTGTTHGTTSGAASTTSGGGTCPGGAPTCDGECCQAGWGCINNICCEFPCNGTCCNGAQACATVTGVTQCMTTCNASARCPPNSPCCIPTGDGGPNVCIDADPSNGQCICATASDCDAGGDTACCAPATDPGGNPVGPYVCKPNDGASYDCCYGTFNTCGDDYCCVKDTPGNEFCAKACSEASDCPEASCQNYDFSDFATTCEGPTACGPQ